ncbi:MAG: HAD family hydrolase [Alcaligenaceae bacterium]|nr:HAD family hydrolase [Alcaligenaceae bacterium]
MTHKNLALFDLDHTLLPIDTDVEWVDFLARNNLAGDPELIQKKNQELMDKYTAGVLRIEESAEFMLGFLKMHTPYDLARFHEKFMCDVVRPAIKQSAIELVKQHQESGDLCCIVTATNTFVTAPVARAFGIENLIGVLPEYTNGRYTGHFVGTPSYREGKVTRVNEWLSSLGKTLNDFNATYFYSDSQNDLPLLEVVSNPVATNPGEVLRKTAEEKGWPVIDLFALK